MFRTPRVVYRRGRMTDSTRLAPQASELYPSKQCRRKRRSKTFTGCWTCRSRAVKCDEGRPSCIKCLSASLSCQGYGIRLVWPGEPHTGQGRRRLFPAAALANEPLLSEDLLDQDLELLDSVAPGGELFCGLFGVLSLERRHPDSQTTLTESDKQSISQRRNEAGQTPRWPSSSSSPAGVDQSDALFSHTPERTNRALRNAQSFVESSNTVAPYNQSLSCFEDELLQCWKTRLSGLMTPIPQRNNIFTNVITPLAEQALSERIHSHAHLALLHALLAMTAFWRENMLGADGRDLGRMYLNSSLSLLTQCLEDSECPQVILAAISTLLVIPAFTGEYSAWRIHLHGGIAWLQSVRSSIWDHSETSLVLLQLFSYYESLIPASGWTMSVNAGYSNTTLELDLGSDAQWHLYDVLGMTKQTMSCIRRINIFLHDTRPTTQELDELELSIYRSDPTGITVSSLDQDCAELAQQHARLYYYATHLYFSRCLTRVPAEKVQHFVRSSVNAIRRIHALEREV